MVDYSYSMQPKSASGLGIAAVAVGSVAALLGFVPFCGMFAAIPLGGIGLLLGIVGAAIAHSGGRQRMGFAIGGIVVSAASIIISILSTIIVATLLPAPTPVAAPIPPIPTTQRAQSQGQRMTIPGPDDNRVGLTREKVEQLREGMTYRQVVDVLGKPGVEVPDVESSNLKTYTWSGYNAERLQVIFEKGGLVAKTAEGVQ